MVESLETTSVVWKQIAEMWNVYFTSPSRISTDEVEKYREWLKQLNNECKPLKALVLGATPELRDALNEFGYETTIIDINLEMILAMNSLLKIKNPNEILVRANWLENPLQSGYFDAIVGDAILPNVPWNKRDALLSEVKRLLKPDGIFITRAFCVPREKPFKNTDELLKKFSKKEPTCKSALEFVLDVQIMSYDSKDHLGTFSKPKEVIEKYRTEKGFAFESENLNIILDIVWNFWSKKFIDKVFVYAYGDEEEKEYMKTFEIVKTFEAKDNEYSKITPMYLLKLKS
ncbi:MAG: class I SAM-dependent methyltransferase [Nanoarchaeota archaeon]|nr:class I SAM-dependent methyltransferase [Nanoarchaeota archaeon]MBU4301096.1 class I SAM-dependent methyltransferase [Nanoarchaeota archaeon]MBU4451912.1 class I SAM-dependent methyltransferase [Nanoarchaeota archaeon]MCG2724603.1 class I SAM-dependent methyltransferase [archaeon]